MKYFVCLLANLFIIAVLNSFVEGSEYVRVGMYYPDFRAIRTIFAIDGATNLPKGYQQQILNDSWKDISEEGKILILKERDLAMVVISNLGLWYYRTSGNYLLKSLREKTMKLKSEDAEHFEEILKTKWFDILREFYSKLLFAQTDLPDRLGELISSLDDLPDVNKEQITWIKVIIGNEIYAMNSEKKKELLSNKKYAPVFNDVIAKAENNHKRQIDVIEKALTTEKRKGIDCSGFAKSVYGKLFGIELPNNVSVARAGNKDIIYFSVDKGKVFLVNRHKNSTEKIVSLMKHSGLENDSYLQLKRNDIAIFLGAPGTDKIYPLN